jgi:transcriptional regulator with XRE-family HTH domain
VLVRLSQDVNELRESADWSQDALARAAGISDGKVLDIEKARRDPHVSTLVRLAFVFGCQLEVRFRRAPPASVVLQDPR